MGPDVSLDKLFHYPVLTDHRSYFGRRTLYIAGLVALFFILIGIGGCGFAPANATIVQTRQVATIRVNKGASWGAGSLLLVFTLIYGKYMSARGSRSDLDRYCYLTWNTRVNHMQISLLVPYATQLLPRLPLHVSDKRPSCWLEFYTTSWVLSTTFCFHRC